MQEEIFNPEHGGKRLNKKVVWGHGDGGESKEQNIITIFNEN